MWINPDDYKKWGKQGRVPPLFNLKDWKGGRPLSSFLHYSVWSEPGKSICCCTQTAPFMLSGGALFSADHKIEIHLFSWEVQMEMAANISEVNLSKDRFCAEVAYEMKTKPTYCKPCWIKEKYWCLSM